jgi:hypothetical protein
MSGGMAQFLLSFPAFNYSCDMFRKTFGYLGVVALAATNIVQAESYFAPNSTGFKLQNGYERVYIQVLLHCYS